MVLEGRYFHGIVIMMNKPEERKYFILDSDVGILSVFNSLMQQRPTSSILVCQCLMSPQTHYENFNTDLLKKFEV
jgi:hypothetical protein